LNARTLLRLGNYFPRITPLQITAPLIPRLKGAGDTRHFQEYQEKLDVCKIKAENMHANEFEDF
jgi:hypothetical protein